MNLGKLVPQKATFTIAELAKALDVHISSVWRWSLRGVRGHQLRTVHIGGRRRILREDALIFLGDLNASSGGETVPNTTARLEYVDAELDAAGL
jgi:hypothetical protein